MRLTRVEIEGYRSIRARVDLRVERDVTVLLGPNDHGKTNILSAFEHLNKDRPFDSDRDLNWDLTEQHDAFPSLTFHFRLDDTHRDVLLQWLQDSDDQDPQDDLSDTTEPSEYFDLTDIPRDFTVQVTGVDATRDYRAGRIPSSLLEEFAEQFLPRVEIIRPHERIPDAVSVHQLKDEAYEFMRGILYYAGIEPADAEALFTQNDATMRQLKKASVTLNRRLKEGWIQGEDLHYELSHDSASEQVLLRIEDPAVGSRMVRASRRSSGFTHFFALKTILYARQRDHVANRYIYLFDEPGIYLHPSGQYDLIAVLDAIGEHNQVLYSTHSLFMLNKTFPARHRLIVKDDSGTKMDGKPYVGRWGPAIDELGFSLAGTVLFAQYVVLAEGESDPVLLQAVFQKLVEWGKASVDLNAFSVIPTGNSRNTDALIRILTEGANAPSVLVVVDGDSGGRQRLKSLRALLRSHSIDSYALPKNTTIEDHLPAPGRTYVAAVARYTARIAATLGRNERSQQQIEDALREALQKEESLRKNVTFGIANRAIEHARVIAGLDSSPSKLGVARDYVDILSQSKPDDFKTPQLKRSLDLLKVIQRMLGIPELKEPDQRVTMD